MNSETDISNFTWQTWRQALAVYSSFSNQDKDDMADTYQEAFGNYPWYERYKCPKCGDFLKDAFCPKCKVVSKKEAYPKSELISKDFPEMLTTYVPGMISLARQNLEVVSFTTGGFARLDNLISKKYKQQNPVKIKKSIADFFDVNLRTEAFYDNETCVKVNLQRSGIGTELSQTRIDQAIALGAVAICGRSINKKWLDVKEFQFLAAGFSFARLVPNGDKYQVDGKPRYFYLAQKQ